MGLLDKFSDQQRTALLVGVPVVGAAVLFKSRQAAPEPVAPEAADPTGTIGAYMPSTDAIGTGQLASFETGVTGSLIDLTTSINDLINKPNTTPAPTTPPGPTLEISGSPPVVNGKTSPAYRTRTATVRTGGERMDVLSRRLYSSGTYWKYLAYANPGVIRNGIGETGTVPGGTVIRY